MRNLLFMTFITMGLLFTSCAAFNLQFTGRAQSDSPPTSPLKILDFFTCEFQFVNESDELLYSHVDTTCIERNQDSENCFLGNRCTHSNLALSHKIIYGEDTVNYFVNFSYDHFVNSTKHKAMLYVCDQSSLNISSTTIKKDILQDECMPPQLGIYDVLFEKIEESSSNLESVTVPGFLPQIFQGHLKLDSGEVFQVFCEPKKTTVGTGCLQ